MSSGPRHRYRLIITPKALKQLRKLHPENTRRVRAFIDQRIQGTTDPRRFGKPLTNSEFWSYRVGEYRILAHIQDEVLVIHVVDLAHRREIYRKLQ